MEIVSESYVSVETPTSIVMADRSKHGAAAVTTKIATPLSNRAIQRIFQGRFGASHFSLTACFFFTSEM
jgi:hypothetical protein